MKLREGRKESKRRPYRKRERKGKKRKTTRERYGEGRRKQLELTCMNNLCWLVRSRTTREAAGNVLGDRERNQIEKKEREKRNQQK